MNRGEDFRWVGSRCPLTRSLQWGIYFISTGPLLPCQEKLGVESGTIIDDQLQSSSDLSNGTSKQQWRLNQEPNTGVPGGWVALDSSRHQWLQISLYRQTPITGVILQGREDDDQWVTSFTVQTSLDGSSWKYVPGIDIYGRANEEEVKNRLSTLQPKHQLFNKNNNISNTDIKY